LDFVINVQGYHSLNFVVPSGVSKMYCRQ